MKNFQRDGKHCGQPNPLLFPPVSPQCAGLLFMRSSRSSPCGVSACPSPYGWTGSGGGGLPTRSSACKDPSQTRTGSHGNQGTGNPPSCGGGEKQMWSVNLLLHVFLSIRVLLVLYLKVRQCSFIYRAFHTLWQLSVLYVCVVVLHLMIIGIQSEMKLVGLFEFIMICTLHYHPLYTCITIATTSCTWYLSCVYDCVLYSCFVLCVCDLPWDSRCKLAVVLNSIAFTCVFIDTKPMPMSLLNKQTNKLIIKIK